LSLGHCQTVARCDHGIRVERVTRLSFFTPSKETFGRTVRGFGGYSRWHAMRHAAECKCFDRCLTVCVVPYAARTILDTTDCPKARARSSIAE
jgi:hypothetical protein